MARTAGAHNKSRAPPKIEYSQQEDINKFICYNVYIHLESGGEIGWNSDPKEKPVPLSVEHYWSSQYLISLLLENQFKHHARVS